MRTLISALVMSVLAASLCAQEPSVVLPQKNAASKNTVREVKSGKTAALPEKARKQAEVEPDEGTVMVDSKADPDDAWSSAPEADKEPLERGEAGVPGGMPSSYGQCKGVVNEGGRNILVFENAEDGAVYFVQVTVGKNNASWKLVARIPRSSD